MRGIQINNYFNNHITLNNKKINPDQPQTIQSNRVKQSQNTPHENDNIAVESKSPPSKSRPFPVKKRTNTLVQLKKHIPQKRSVSTERLRNATSAKKRCELASYSSERQQQLAISMSQRRLKINNNKGGLGKRSKSTIIKGVASQNNKEISKKEPKKINSSNTNQSIKPLKSKRKKSSKTIEVVKESRPTVTNKNSISKKEVKEITPFMSKQVKKEKLTLKLDQTVKCGKASKKSARTNKNSIIAQPKNLKIVSARQKKCNKNRFIQELKEKYENQDIFEESPSSRIKNTEQHMDNQFLSVMNNLEKVLSSVNSKQKLKKQLEMINEKLKQFRINSVTDEQKQQQIMLCSKIDRVEDQSGVNQNNLHESKRNEEIEKRELFSKHYEQQNSQESEKESKGNEDDQLYQRMFAEQVKNPLIGKRNNHIFFVEDKQEQSISANQRKAEIELLKKFKSQSTVMMEKVGLKKKEEQSCQRQPKQLTLDNVSGLSSGSLGSNGNNHAWQDKYPLFPSKSPRFDEIQLKNVISIKQQFLSSKHDKMSELVKKMFEKQIVSPKSYEFQIRSLDKKYEEQNLMLQSFKKQAEQLSSMLSQIKKDKQEIQGIDELIRNQKWEEAQKLVEKREEQHECTQPQLKNKQQMINEKKKKKQDIFSIPAWQKQQGWERVNIKKSDLENNEFVDLGQMTNRGRRGAQARIDIDQECGGTEQSEQLQPHQTRQEDYDEYIYYNEQSEADDNKNQQGLIRLVQISNDKQKQTEQSSAQDNVFHIKDEQAKDPSQPIQRNISLISGSSSQTDRKGFVSNLYFIKEYCIALCQFVRDNEIFKSQFKHNVSKPLEYNTSKMLSDMRDEENVDFNYCKRTNKVPITQHIWNEFNNQYETLKFNSNNFSIKNAERYKVQKEMELIFVKMIYDVLNESLDSQRPGGLSGKALPWKESAKHLKNFRQLSKEEQDNVQAYDLMFGVAIARIIQWGSCLCGFLPDTVELQNTEIDQPYVNHIRQTRMAFLLQKMMAQEQAVMTNFELQETEVEVKLSQLIYSQLISQVQNELQQFFKQ